VIHFFNGLLPVFKKHGHYDTATLTAFTQLDKYWSFLRRQVSKDEAKRLVNVQVKNSSGTVPVVGAIQPFKTIWSDAEKAAYKVKKQAERDALKSKRKHEDTPMPDAKRQKQPQGNQRGQQQQQQGQSGNPTVQGEFTFDKCHHSGLPVLKGDELFPPGYQLPTEPLTFHPKINYRLSEVYLRMFKDAPPKLVKAILSNAETRSKMANPADRNKHDWLCIFHGHEGHHKSLSCPAYRCHYPSSTGPAMPTMNP
jgi:hypothetical protein